MPWTERICCTMRNLLASFPGSRPSPVPVLTVWEWGQEYTVQNGLGMRLGSVPVCSGRLSGHYREPELRLFSQPAPPCQGTLFWLPAVSEDGPGGASGGNVMLCRNSPEFWAKSIVCSFCVRDYQMATNMGLQNKKKFHKATGLTCMVAKCDPITAVSTYASDNLLPCHTFWTSHSCWKRKSCFARFLSFVWRLQPICKGMGVLWST